MINASGNKQRGSLLVILIVIVALLIVAGIGYLLWTNFLQTKSDDEALSAIGSKVETKLSKSPEIDTSVLNIEDWGIEFTIPEYLRNTSIKYFERKSNEGSSVYVFTTSRIQELGGKCLEQTFGDTINIIKFTEKPVAVPDGELLNQELVNGYYYALGGPIASCSGFDESGVMRTPSQIEIDDRRALKEMARTLKSTD